jgi:competence protein ComGC
MKILLLLIICTLLFSCTNVQNKKQAINKNVTIAYEVIVIENCEYILSRSQITSSETMTHKGNCKNHPRSSYKE